MHAEQGFKIKHINQFPKDYLYSLLPKLLSYVAFNIRLNRMFKALKRLSDKHMKTRRSGDSSHSLSIKTKQKQRGK